MTEPLGVTKPQAGVMTTRPATAPEQKPIGRCRSSTFLMHTSKSTPGRLGSRTARPARLVISDGTPAALSRSVQDQGDSRRGRWPNSPRSLTNYSTTPSRTFSTPKRKFWPPCPRWRRRHGLRSSKQPSRSTTAKPSNTSLGWKRSSS